MHKYKKATLNPHVPITQLQQLRDTIVFYLYSTTFFKLENLKASLRSYNFTQKYLSTSLSDKDIF